MEYYGDSVNMNGLVQNVHKCYLNYFCFFLMKSTCTQYKGFTFECRNNVSNCFTFGAGVQALFKKYQKVINI